MAMEGIERSAAAQPSERPAPQEDGNANSVLSMDLDSFSISAYEPRDDLPDLERYRVVRTLVGHSRAVTAVRFSPDGTRLASASADGTCKLWDVQSGELLHTLQGHDAGISDVCWHGDGLLLATASDDLSVKLWSAETGACLRTLRGHTHVVFSCCFSAGGNMLATASFDETLALWDVRSGQRIRNIPAHSDPLTGVAFDGSGRAPLIATSSFDGLSRVWEANTGKCVATLQEPGNLPMAGIRFTPNSKYLLIGTVESKLYMWDFRSNQIKKTYTGHKCTAYCLHSALLVSDPAGELVLSGSEDHHVYAWHLNSRSVAGLLRGRPSEDAPGDGHCDAVLAVDANPVLPMIASGGYERDRTVKLWAPPPPT